MQLVFYDECNHILNIAEIGTFQYVHSEGAL